MLLVSLESGQRTGAPAQRRMSISLRETSSCSIVLRVHEPRHKESALEKL